MAKPKRILYPVLFMLLITAVYTSVLAGINAISLERINIQEALRLQRAVLFVNDIEASDDQITEMFASSFYLVTKNDLSYYVRKENDQILSYTFPFKGKALWGTVDGYIAFDANLKTILGVDFLKHSETPGLGGRIDEAWFKEQFRGISLETTPFLRYQNESKGNIDAITGATLTSNAIKSMLNDFINNLKVNEGMVIANE